jgi:type II secretory ATPase GspE/PulE/Tfp pilus assembly ATPase PilB-like protein
MQNGAYMNSRIILIIIIPQLILIFGQIYKSSIYLQYSYAKQRNLKHVDELIEKNNELTRLLAQAKSKKTIKGFALNKGMEPLKLKNVKKIAELYESKPLSGPTN